MNWGMKWDHVMDNENDFIKIGIVQIFQASPEKCNLLRNAYSLSKMNRTKKKNETKIVKQSFCRGHLHSPYLLSTNSSGLFSMQRLCVHVALLHCQLLMLSLVKKIQIAKTHVIMTYAYSAQSCHGNCDSGTNHGYTRLVVVVSKHGGQLRVGTTTV